MTVKYDLKNDWERINIVQKGSIILNSEQNPNHSNTKTTERESNLMTHLIQFCFSLIWFRVEWIYMTDIFDSQACDLIQFHPSDIQV